MRLLTTALIAALISTGILLFLNAALTAITSALCGVN